MSSLTARVEETRRLTRHLVRVVLGGDDLADHPEPEFTDAYLKMTFPGPDGPVARRYSVRRWDAGARLLTVDFVVHGDEGVAGPWAAAARPGDEVGVSLPGGSYRPDLAAAWHLMVGDESALPAIAASLEQVPAGAPTVVRLVCDGPEDELALASPGALDVVWLHRRGADDPVGLLPQAVRDMPFLRGPVHAFVHGEAGEVRDVRRHLLGERGVDRALLSASGYWRRTMTDEAWRRVKAAWNAEVERDVPAA
ncbi:MAG: siderophore-interacting protein [Kineosporiaceae bacterium]